MKDYSQYKLNLKPSPKDNRDWQYQSFVKAYTYPPVLDLKNQMFAVRDQGSQGSCAAMSGAAMKDWQEMTDVSMSEYMSPQFIYNNREDLSEEGMYMRNLMNILKILGTCRESMWAYGKITKPSQAAYNEALNYIVKGYASIDTIDELKQALYDNGPCVIAVPVYNYGARMWKQRTGDYFLGGHAMAIVGYNNEGFIIRNSWGDDWNGTGYTIFPYEDWGLQYEAWTTIDADSNIKPDPNPVPGWWTNLWYWTVILAVILGIIAFFIF